MPSSDIPAYSSSESVGSSISLVVLSDSKIEMTVALAYIPVVSPKIAPVVEATTIASPVGTLDLTVHLDSESDPSEDPPSSDHPLEDSSEKDTPEQYKATIARWIATVASRSSSSASTPLASLQIVPALPRRLAIMVLPGRRFPLVDLTIPSLTRRRVPPYSSSSASHSSSSSDGPSRKRVRSPTTSLSAASHSLATLPPIRANLLPPCKRLWGSLSAFHQEISIGVSIEDSTEVGYEASIEDGTKTTYETSIKATIEVTTEVAVKPIPHEQILAQRIEEIEEEQKTLKDRADTTEAERTALCGRIRSLEISDLSLRDTLRVEREAYSRIERRLGFAREELR
ncbi:hypothetical protein Tco_0766379 [Tanacetum coccineum]